jgi:acyl-[acyl-carrier-protein]-phospholipid O-acyltransferase/long-chain-fatty-acid--[acyl-carrier-protein] ligase
MFGTLMTSRRFAPLFWCQFLSAFNDNFVRQMLVMLILFRFGGADAGAKVTLAIGVFVLPSLFLSALGGELADSHDKAIIARRLKFAELFVQLVAAAGFWLASLPTLYAALLGLGVISALFGPIKYGILPDQLRREELVAGNALVEGATFAAILCGLIAGGFAAAQGRAAWTVALQLAVVGLACWGASRFIARTGVGAPGLAVNPNPFASTREILRELRRDDRQWVGGAAVSWFWLVGAVSLSLVPVVVKSRIGGGIEVETAINMLFAVGIAVGSLLAAIFAHGRIQLAPAPYLLVAIGAVLIDLGVATGALPQTTIEIGLFAFFSRGAGLHLVADVLALSALSGLFVVPVFAAVQAWAGAERRARVIGAVNTLNAAYMVAGSLATSVLLKGAGLDESSALAVLGVATILAAAYLFRRLPKSPTALAPAAHSGAAQSPEF